MDIVQNQMLTIQEKLDIKDFKGELVTLGKLLSRSEDLSGLFLLKDSLAKIVLPRGPDQLPDGVTREKVDVSGGRGAEHLPQLDAARGSRHDSIAALEIE